MGEGVHLQLLVDVVVSNEANPGFKLSEVISVVNGALHQAGCQETVWAVRPPWARDLPSEHASGAS